MTKQDPLLQSRAATWYALDWAVWGTGALAGASLLLALIRPVTTPVAVSSLTATASKPAAK